MPIITLSTTQRLISTSRTWEWQRLKVRKNKFTNQPINTWIFFRNYTTLENALIDVANVGLRTSTHEDIGHALLEVKNALATLAQAITQPIMSNVQEITKEVNDGPKS